MYKRFLFSIMVATQLAIPCWMVYSMETVLSQGTPWRFKTAPVDPYDIFRGKFVALAVEEHKVDYHGSEQFIPGQTVYAILDKDDDGFARFKDLRLTRPDKDPYLKTRVSYHQTMQNIEIEQGYKQEKVNIVHLNLPFDRYYMNEKKAPEAERHYREHNVRGQKSNAFIEVQILNGKGFIKDLYLDGKPVENFFHTKT